MQRTSSQTNFRARAVVTHPAQDQGLESRSSKLAGKVALLHVLEPSYGALLALRYAREGADVALVCAEPSAELEAAQQQIESLGGRCLLYEIVLDDTWNCGLVVQSTTECLGPVDFLVDVSGRVFLLEEGEELTAEQLRDAVGSPRHVEPRTRARISAA